MADHRRKHEASRNRSRTAARLRLSITLVAKSRAALEAIRRHSGAVSTADAIRRALTLYALVVTQQSSGNTLVLRHKDGSVSPVIVL